MGGGAGGGGEGGTGGGFRIRNHQPLPAGYEPQGHFAPNEGTEHGKLLAPEGMTPSEWDVAQDETDDILRKMNIEIVTHTGEVTDTRAPWDRLPKRSLVLLGALAVAIPAGVAINRAETNYSQPRVAQIQSDEAQIKTALIINGPLDKMDPKTRKLEALAIADFEAATGTDCRGSEVIVATNWGTVVGRPINLDQTRKAVEQVAFDTTTPTGLTKRYFEERREDAIESIAPAAKALGFTVREPIATPTRERALANLRFQLNDLPALGTGPRAEY